MGFTRAGMPSAIDPLGFVLSSSVRADLLRAVADGTTSTDDLLRDLDASSSAIYSALGRLEDVRLLEARGEGWRLTGSGRLVADFLARRDQLGRLLEGAGEYLATHDTGVLPRRYRHRMSELADADVLEAAEPDPQGLIREITTRLENTTSVDVLAPIYVDEHGSVLPTIEDSRLVIDERIVATAVEAADSVGDVEAELEDYVDEAIRIASVDFALTVTDDALLLSLPTLDGSYDARTEFVAEHERGRQWGTELFESFWADAEPLESYVSYRFL